MIVVADGVVEDVDQAFCVTFGVECGEERVRGGVAGVVLVDDVKV